MSEGNGLMDVPIVWEEMVVAPEPIAAEGGPEEEESVGNVESSIAESEVESKTHTGEELSVTRERMNDLINEKSEMEEKIQELEEENRELHIRNWWTNEGWNETVSKLLGAEKQNKALKEEVEKKEREIAKLKQELPQ